MVHALEFAVVGLVDFGFNDRAQHFIFAFDVLTFTFPFEHRVWDRLLLEDGFAFVLLQLVGHHLSVRRQVVYLYPVKHVVNPVPLVKHSGLKLFFD